MTRRVQGPKAKSSHLMDRVIVEKVVVTREQIGVFTADPDPNAGISNLLDRANMVPVTVRFEN